MKYPKKSSKMKAQSFRVSQRKGSALVAAVTFVLIMGMVVGYVLVASNDQTRRTYRSQLFDSTLAASGTAIKSMADQAYYLANTRPEQLTGGMNGMNKLMESISPAPVTGYTAIKYNNKPLSYYIPTGANDNTYNQITDKEDRWYGFSIRQWKYEGVSFLKPDDPGTDRLGFGGAGFRQTVAINHIPLHQFAIFYDGDLEIHPGPAMDIRGPVHSNKTLWVSSGGGINFYSSVSAARNIRRYRDFKFGYQDVAANKINGLSPYDGKDHIETSDHTSAVNIKDKNSNAMNALGTKSSLDTDWLTWATARWNGNVFANSQSINPPLPLITDTNGNTVQATADLLIARVNKTLDTRAILDRKIESMADILIVADPSNASSLDSLKLVSYKQDFRNVDGVNTGFCNDAINKQIDNVTKKSNGSLDESSRIVSSGTFYDGQQLADVTTLDIDITRLRERLNKESFNFSGKNGVIYISTLNNTSGFKAVRLLNAATLPYNSQKTFTIATDRPLYISGSLNWNGNTNDQGEVTALIAADSITVCSQLLTPQITNGIKSKQPPTPAKSPPKTYTNAILLMGQANSKYAKVDKANKFIVKNGTYVTSDFYQDADDEGRWIRYAQSGGSHNVIRYLENWNGVEHFFNGSLISLFNSKVATGNYDNPQKNQYYDAPIRRYSWNTDFLNRVPPIGLPIVIEVAKGNINRISKQEAINLASRAK